MTGKTSYLWETLGAVLQPILALSIVLGMIWMLKAFLLALQSPPRNNRLWNAIRRFLFPKGLQETQSPSNNPDDPQTASMVGENTLSLDMKRTLHLIRTDTQKILLLTTPTREEMLHHWPIEPATERSTERPTNSPPDQKGSKDQKIKPFPKKPALLSSPSGTTHRHPDRAKPHTDILTEHSERLGPQAVPRLHEIPDMARKSASQDDAHKRTLGDTQ